MSNIELEPTDLHWLDGSYPFEDCCLHGAVYLKIGDTLISDGSDKEWTVSTAAYNLLKTIHKNHEITEERPLIPHCGHTMWVEESEPDGLYLGGCDIGIDWTIQHEADTVLHKIGDGVSVETNSDVWRKAVCQFSDDVFDIFTTAWPKRIADKDDLKGFELFMKLWRQRRVEANVG